MYCKIFFRSGAEVTVKPNVYDTCTAVLEILMAVIIQSDRTGFNQQTQGWYWSVATWSRTNTILTMFKGFTA